MISKGNDEYCIGGNARQCTYSTRVVAFVASVSLDIWEFLAVFVYVLPR